MDDADDGHNDSPRGRRHRIHAGEILSTASSRGRSRPLTRALDGQAPLLRRRPPLLTMINTALGRGHNRRHFSGHHRCLLRPFSCKKVGEPLRPCPLHHHGEDAADGEHAIGVPQQGHQRLHRRQA